MSKIKDYVIELEDLKSDIIKLIEENKELTNRLNRATEHLTIFTKENNKLKEENKILTKFRFHTVSTVSDKQINTIINKVNGIKPLK